MPDGISLSELARRLNRAKSGLHQLAKLKQIPRHADGSFDQEEVEAALATNLDPARRKTVHERTNGSQVNGERVNAEAGPFACIDAFDNPAHRGAAWLGLCQVYTLPTTAANLAIAAGAPVRTAFALRRLMIVATMVHLEDALGDMGADISHLEYFPDALDDLDWQAKAKEAGEKHDPKAWTKWLVELNSKLENAV